MRLSRLLLLTLFPAYGLLSIPSAHVVPPAETVLLLSNIVVFVIMLLIGELRLVGGIGLVIDVVSYVAANLAFWLPVAHLVDAVLERARRRRAGRGR